jgi:hypothetical protein
MKVTMNDVEVMLVAMTESDDGPGQAAFDRKQVRARMQLLITETNCVMFSLVEFDVKHT